MNKVIQLRPISTYTKTIMKSSTVSVVAILLVCVVNAADYHEDILGNISGIADTSKMIIVNSFPFKVQERIIEYTVDVSSNPSELIVLLQSGSNLVTK